MAAAYDGGSSAPSAAASGGDVGAAAFMDAEDERLLRNIGDHPLMERVQIALQKQLQTRYDRVDEELRDRAEEAARTAKQREELGVELYGVQQQLAKLQMQLETMQQNATVVAGARAQAEEDLAAFKEILAEQGNLDKFLKELNGVADTVRQVEAYNKEMEAEIALTRRGAYKAEAEVAGKEKVKEEQDVQIDRLNERTK
ncbi:Ccdc40, partial [Symbiodinium sp. KB8]